MKKHKIVITKKGRENVVEGTLPELLQHFSYTFEVGHSWNNKINKNPKTINSFVKNLQASYEEKEASCFERTSVFLIEK